MEEELGAPCLKTVPEPCSPSPVLQEFSKEERDPVKTHEGWGVMLPCNPPAHYPGKWGSWARARLGGAAYQKGLLDAQVRTDRGGGGKPVFKWKWLCNILAGRRVCS